MFCGSGFAQNNWFSANEELGICQINQTELDKRFIWWFINLNNWISFYFNSLQDLFFIIPYATDFWDFLGALRELLF